MHRILESLRAQIKSRVGTRIAFLFIVCAMVPIALVLVFAYFRVLKQLDERAIFGLREESKRVASTIVERLTFLERDVGIIADTIVNGRELTKDASIVSETAVMPQPFTSVISVDADGEATSHLGNNQQVPALSDTDTLRLLQGGTVILTAKGAGSIREIHMVRTMDLTNPGRGRIYSIVNPDYLWNMFSDSKPIYIAQMCILDESDSVVYAYAPRTTKFMRELKRNTEKSSSAVFELSEHGRNHIVAAWSPNLEYHFGIRKWTIVLSQPEDTLLDPILGLRREFLLLVLLSFWVVLFLTITEVRRRLIPLSELSVGTREIAETNFESRVDIRTGDEFEDLGESFNKMAETIGQQFKKLNAIGDVDHALLSAVSMDDVAKQALTGLRDIYSNRNVGVTLVGSNGTARHQFYVAIPGTREPVADQIEPLATQTIATLTGNPGGIRFPVGRERPDYLCPMDSNDTQAIFVMPIILDNNLEGMICMEDTVNTTPAKDEEHLCHLADQLALGIANARLVGRLRKMNWGIVYALARAVDAKSSWTQGHSQRVTQVSLAIAREMGYGPKELEIMERGGLLHDIGKIGISASILDKPSKLTEKERMIIQEHPRIGRRIVEPIDVEDDVVNIVSQHHERFDGNGYPLGLSGYDISLSGRIAAVADCVDAVGADRPYRKAMDFSEVIDLVKSDADKAFDPEVVAAFCSIVKRFNSLEELVASEPLHHSVEG
jgi:putative nucleotidyltransferase with HDIG domain